MLARRVATPTFAALLLVAAPAAGQSGGSPSGPAPSVTSVRCTDDCAGRLAQPGSTVTLRGGGLAGATSVVFTGDVTAPPRPAKDGQLTATVPAGATSGPVAVLGADGQASGPSPKLAIAVTATPPASSAPVATAVALPEGYVGGAQPPTLSYRLNTPDPATVTVSVVRLSGKVAAILPQGKVAPGEVRTVGWGRQPGRFRFVVTLVSDAASASTARTTGDAFTLRPAVFPIRGKHDYGEGQAAFGAGRSGHVHQGQDVFAACGTPLVVARGGVVQERKFQGLAGNYVVIDGAYTDVDQVYAHLRDPALPAVGTRVYTGDPLGAVGDTGDASECHLHFEEWSGPGWYEGGSAFDPRADLKMWDAYS